MISNNDKKYNKLYKLDKSKWTSLEKLNGWKHYEVINVNKKSNKMGRLDLPVGLFYVQVFAFQSIILSNFFLFLTIAKLRKEKTYENAS